MPAECPIPGSGYYKHPGIIVLSEIYKRFSHLPPHGGVHGIHDFGPV
jgi:hypothetical protein